MKASDITMKQRPASFLTFDSFVGSSGVRHGFFTRQVDDDREIADMLGAQRVYRCHQIHSVICHKIGSEPDKIWQDGARPQGDALVTDQAGLALGVLTADCIPALFYGEKKSGAPVIGAAHAGWSGAFGGVLEETVNKMRGIGADISSIRVAIGPCIHQKSYEVGPEFFARFIEKDPLNEQFFSKNISNISEDLYEMHANGYDKNHEVKPGRNQGRDLEASHRESYQFDLPAYAIERLKNADIEHIFFNPDWDTYIDESRFHSYRRFTHQKKAGATDPGDGRLISAISIEPDV